MATILCLDDDARANALLESYLLELGHHPVLAGAAAPALRALSEESVDLIIADYQMPGLTGLDFLSVIREQGYDQPLIILTAHASIEHAVGSIKVGAINYLPKPVVMTQLRASVDQALEIVSLKREVESLRAEMNATHNVRQIVGSGPAMRRLMKLITTVAPTRATVLIQGESGTGKELVARAVHQMSDRRNRPFIRLNCAALPEGLIESALFGHEKGAFTGAIKRSEGAFERAHGGTLLLDEISEMRLDLQAKLLRVLQEQEFERVGGASTIEVDVRVVATTNRDLATVAQQGGFRQDLYYRLNTVHMILPPLRDRPEDIPALATHFMLRSAAEASKRIEGIAPDAMELLQTLPWPGNIRELEHAIERAVVIADGSILTRALFSRVGEGPTPPGQRRQEDERLDLSERLALPSVRGPQGIALTSLNLEEAERALLGAALRASKGNRTAAARLLGIHVRTLRRKLAQLSMEDAAA